MEALAQHPSIESKQKPWGGQTPAFVADLSTALNTDHENCSQESREKSKPNFPHVIHLHMQLNTKLSITLNTTLLQFSAACVCTTQSTSWASSYLAAICHVDTSTALFQLFLLTYLYSAVKYGCKTPKTNSNKSNLPCLFTHRQLMDAITTPELSLHSFLWFF